jgi:hypothetical protein
VARAAPKRKGVAAGGGSRKRKRKQEAAGGTAAAATTTTTMTAAAAAVAGVEGEEQLPIYCATVVATRVDELDAARAIEKTERGGKLLSRMMKSDNYAALSCTTTTGFGADAIILLPDQYL